MMNETKNLSGNLHYEASFLGLPISSPVQIAGFTFAVVCILSWNVVHTTTIRQRHSRFKKKIKQRFYPVLHVFIADGLNALGAILSQQLPTQICIALYLAAMDVMIYLHHLYMSTMNLYHISKNRPDYNGLFKDKAIGKSIPNFCIASPWLAGFLYLLFWQKTPSPGSGYSPQSHQSRFLLNLNTNRDTLLENSSLVQCGYALGLLSCLFYWTSAIPQIRFLCQGKVFARKQLIINIGTLIAEVMYLFSVYLYSTKAVFLIHTMPWVLGRLGVIVIELVILGQTWANSRRKSKDKNIDEEVVASLLQNEDDEDDDVSVPGKKYECRPWIPMEELPRTNRYLKKMRRIAKTLDDPDATETGDECDEQLSERKWNEHQYSNLPTNVEVNLEYDVCNYELTVDDVQEILADEDCQREGVVLSPLSTSTKSQCRILKKIVQNNHHGDEQKLGKKSCPTLLSLTEQNPDVKRDKIRDSATEELANSAGSPVPVYWFHEDGKFVRQRSPNTFITSDIISNDQRLGNNSEPCHKCETTADKAEDEVVTYNQSSTVVDQQHQHGNLSSKSPVHWFKEKGPDLEPTENNLDREMGDLEKEIEDLLSTA